MSDDAKTTPDQSPMSEANPAGAAGDSTATTLEVVGPPKRPTATIVDDGSPIEEAGKAVFLGAAAGPNANKTHIPDEGVARVTRTLDESELRAPPPAMTRRRPARGGSPWLLIVVALVGVGGLVAVIIAKWPAGTASDGKPTRANASSSATSRPSSKSSTPVETASPDQPADDPEQNLPSSPGDPQSPTAHRHHHHPGTEPTQPQPQPQPQAPEWIPTVLPSMLPPFPSAFPNVLPSALPPFAPQQ